MSLWKIADFKVHHDDWRLYVERLEEYFLVNKIPKALQVPTLITVMGAECYELLVNLCTPVKPTNKTLAEINDVMEKHLQPKPGELAERYKFRHRKQKEGETVSEYAAALKKMSKTCDFGSWLEESLRDQLVCGVANETIRQRLFIESNLDFGKAYKLAVNMEAAEKDAAAVEAHGVSRSLTTTVTCQAMIAGSRRGGTAGAVSDVSGAPREAASRGMRWRGSRAPVAAAPTKLGERVQQQQCRVCGARHEANKCKFARYVCRVCNQQGHLKRMCPNVEGHYNVDMLQVRDETGSRSEGSDESAKDGGSVICNSCNAAIQGRIVTALDKKWHPEHLLCNTCHKPIDGAKFHQHDGGVHCVICYAMYHSPRCHGCGDPITDRVIQALGMSWHAHHFVCGGCKKELGGGGFIEQAGHPYCGSCYADKYAARCAGCASPIVDKAIIALDAKWHRDCFTCTKCRNPVTDSTFSVLDNKPLCGKCA